MQVTKSTCSRPTLLTAIQTEKFVLTSCRITIIETLNNNHFRRIRSECPQVFGTIQVNRVISISQSHFSLYWCRVAMKFYYCYFRFFQLWEIHYGGTHTHKKINFVLTNGFIALLASCNCKRTVKHMVQHSNWIHDIKSHGGKNDKNLETHVKYGWRWIFHWFFELDTCIVLAGGNDIWSREEMNPQSIIQL